MAKTITQGFDLLKTNLEITTLQEETVSERQTNVRKAIAAEMDVLDSFLMGSYKRSTMIAPLAEADVDIFIVLNHQYYSVNGQQKLLEEVRRILLKTYTRTPKISPNGQAVTITFTDFKVDVVPGFYRQEGGYLIPDSKYSRWIATDPKKHIELWAASNKAHNGDFIPLVKMIKGWNKTHGHPLQSFHLECMVREALTNVTISNYWSGARYVFDKMRALILSTTLDPAGFGGDVGSYLTQPERNAAWSACDAAFTNALQAEALEQVGQTQQAFDQWRKVFGDYFPAY